MKSRDRTRHRAPDGKPVYLLQKRAHLLVCAKGCCCGRTDRGNPAVPVNFYKKECASEAAADGAIDDERLRGPCPMMNVALLVFDGRPTWFQSINSEPQILQLYDYIEAMLTADGCLPTPPDLLDYRFDYYLWGGPEWAARARPAATRSPSARAGILFLSHADTDLTTLSQVTRELPDAFPMVRGLGLGRVQSDEHMAAMLTTHGDSARSSSCGSSAERRPFPASADSPSRHGPTASIWSS